MPVEPDGRNKASDVFVSFTVTSRLTAPPVNDGDSKRVDDSSHCSRSHRIGECDGIRIAAGLKIVKKATTPDASASFAFIRSILLGVNDLVCRPHLWNRLSYRPRDIGFSTKQVIPPVLSAPLSRWGRSSRSTVYSAPIERLSQCCYGRRTLTTKQ